MRLPTITQYQNQVKLLSSQFDKVTRLQAQSATGEKLLKSSENPLLADKIKSLKVHFDDLKNFKTNLSLASSRQSAKENTANQLVSMTVRTKELVQQAKNETLNNNDRAAIAKEIEGIRKQFFDLSNAKDAHGEYIYSGTRTHTAPYSFDGTNFSYQGNATASNMPISIDTRVAYSENGQEVFGAISTGNGEFKTTANENSNLGTGVLNGGRIVSQATYIPGNYTISIVVNGDGKTAYQVTDTNGQVVVPSLPEVSPTNAPEYVDGADINFQGVSVQLSGQPAVGDEFYVQPAEKISIFDQLGELIDRLKTPAANEKELADVQQVLGQHQDFLAQAQAHFINYLETVGNQGRTIETEQNLSASLQASDELYLNDIASANLEEVISDLAQQTIMLQMTQKIYGKLQELQQSTLLGN